MRLALPVFWAVWSGAERGGGMNIVICGLGYVGATTTACLLKDGHSVSGIDPDPRKRADMEADRKSVV